MRVGILGGGQLGRMLALAGHPLGLECVVLEPNPEAPARPVSVQLVAAYDDAEALAELAARVDVVTYEFENVPVAAARFLAERVAVRPPPAALEVAQDRLAEKTCFQRLGIPTPPFVPVHTRADLEEAVARVGLPAVLKTRRLGYDGKGQRVLREAGDVEAAWAALGGAPLILEGFVPFGREVSILAVRAQDGTCAFYPLVENRHEAGILRLSRAPAPDTPPELQEAAEVYARRVLEALEYVGVLAIEFFQVDGRLVANEMAPRVHNSGHWTIEGAETSQFENHLRAVAGLPLGSTAPRGVSAMLNLIGQVPEPAAVLRVPGAHLHLYGKTPRPGRKLGHVTVCADDTATLEARLAALRAEGVAEP
ncbi:5-(carboxyamino)imidazole ribonucleotide synthase [Marinithermus hydrothermalis]|uniref:N5-carboxyaminoimidazole ribonucleotide synthase n=1 Tax=Marinithermus hydrothermalis (strain DSM 14884 / JCM 11576 / T1) TaxID=869210 RepID=F2NMN9_MARHT|nr:5-(carboxyamino)imidazole ribonucleotide synthase [Marinithermus hydrothermalis]AEB12423.1 phosphoribosylaminoimidazole carboxylase, ATPase subunit [Marinithermus hydrothermalis DSM 14884]